MAGSIPSLTVSANPVNLELEESLDDTLSVSSISDPVVTYMINNVLKLKCRFIYNYFVKNEREINSNKTGTDIVIESNYEDNFDIDYLLSQSEKLPRSVLLTYEKFSLSDGLELTDSEKTLLSNITSDDITREGHHFDARNILYGVSLRDTDSNSEITEKIKYSSILIKNEPIGDASYQDTAKSLSDLLNNPGGVTGIGKKILIEKLNATRSKGLALSKYENNEVISTSPVGSLVFKTKINKLFSKNILNYGVNFNSGIFESELTSLNNQTASLQELMLRQIENSGGPDAINDSLYGLYASPVDMRPIPENIDNLSDLVTKKNAGYLIEKIEQFPDGTSLRRNSVYISNPNQTQYLDSDVRYGGKYIYKVRSIVLFESPVVLLDENPALDQTVLAKFLIASSGVQEKVFCTEDIPPKEPVAINASFDFKLKKPIIKWQLPINKQRDIKRFQVFKRLSEFSPFTLIAEYNFDNSITPTAVREKAQNKNLYNLNPKLPKLSHIDMSFNINQKPIYAVAAVDAHGLTSNLSTQIQVEYLKYENRLNKKLFSKSGAPKQYPNIYINRDTFLDNIKTSGAERMIMFFDPEYYQVFKNAETNKEDDISEINLNHIAVNPSSETYKLHIINLDLQKDETVNITIEDTSQNNLKLDGSSFSNLRYNNFGN